MRSLFARCRPAALLAALALVAAGGVAGAQPKPPVKKPACYYAQGAGGLMYCCPGAGCLVSW